MPLTDNISPGIEFSGIRDISVRSFLSIVVASFAVAVLLHVVLYAAGLYSISADECGRTLDARAWVLGSGVTVDAWLPLYQIVVGEALRLLPDLFLTPRIVSFVVGLFTHSALVILALELFRRRDIAAMTAAISAVIHHRVIFAVVPLAEIMFFCCIIGAMAFLVRWLRTGSAAALLLAALSLAVATTVRYEAWFFGCVLAAGLSAAHVRRTPAVPVRPATTVAALAILALFPTAWLVQHALQHGHPIGFLLHSPDRFEPIAGTSFLKVLWHNALVQFVLQNIATLLLIGLLPAIDMWRGSRAMRLWLAVPLGALLGLSLVLLGGKGLTTHNPWRIASGWSLLLVPFAAHWLVSFVRFRYAGPLWRRLSLPVLVLGLCLFQTMMYTRAASTFTRAERAMGEYIHRHLFAGAGPFTPLPARARVLVETSSWQYLNIAITSQHPEAFVYNSGADPVFPEEARIRNGRPPDTDALRAEGIRYLLFTSPVERAMLDAHPGLRTVQTFGEWVLYELIP